MPAIAIYSVEDASVLSVALAGWSPNGHLLPLTGTDGLSLLREPGDLKVAPAPFGPAGCSGVAWH